VTDKHSLRREAKRRLRALTPAERELAGRSIAERVWELAELRGARALLLYAALEEEVPTDGIADRARRSGIRLVYPRCLPSGVAMTLHEVGSPGELRSGGRYGLAEPAADCPLVEPDEIEVALVPGLAWDRAGHRLGRGAGYYDRLFASPAWDPFRCGIFFAAQELPAIPVDPWDEHLHAVVTELECLRLGDDP
jgi:5-formyltetrahydrofolate cyclo-ligase